MSVVKSFSFLLLSLTVVSCQEKKFVDPQYKLVEWTGWGTSLAWFSDVLGGLDQSVQDEINYALFSPEKLNLNVLRYTIGGTTPGDQTCGPFRQGAATESFKDGPNEPFDWTRDPRARKVLLAAKALGADVFEAFSNSPPSWLTRNNCTKGTPAGAPLHDNFDPKNAAAFADYLTEVVKYYHENYNVTFTSLAPFNEPMSGYWKGPESSQEGCNMERSTMVEVIKKAHAALQAKNISYCSLSVADETEMYQEYVTQQYFSVANISQLHSKVNTHGYADNGREPRPELFSIADKNNHVLWMDEVGWSRSPLEDMQQGISIAERIIYDLRNMAPSAWVYWQVMEDQKPGMWGVLDVPYDNATVENIVYNSGFYAMMQFSKYITIIHVNDGDTLAAYHEPSQTLVLVILNQKDTPFAKQFDLGHFESFAGGDLEAYRTSSTEPHVLIPSPSLAGNVLNSTFPPKSITTFKISSARSLPSSNLILNGDFEDINGQPWFLQNGPRDDSGISDTYPRRGQLSGNVGFYETEVSLMQNVTVSQTGSYFLSAWCATTANDTKFGFLLNGQQGPELTVNSGIGYQLYGLTVDISEPNSTISVYIKLSSGSHTALIDDVELH